MTDTLNRRRVLGLLASAGGAALPIASAVPAVAQLSAPLPGPLPVPGGRALRAPGDMLFSRFAVDASALRTAFNTITANLLERDLARDLRTVFADKVADGGATLVARIYSLYLRPWAGGRNGNDGTGPDNIEGVGIVTAGGRILSQTPLYTTLDPSYSGPYYLPDIDRLRLSSISYQFAYWLRREMNV